MVHKTRGAEQARAGGGRAVALAGASLLALAAVSTAARAADAVPAATAVAESATVTEIVVTAQKREEKVNSVPMSITAVTGAQLAAAGVTEVRDLVKVTPGFSFADSYVGSPIYTLRGVGFSDISLGGRPTVSIYADEAPIPFAIETRGANFDLDRVEVLKGPQGTLFGQNATGGAINFIAARPTTSFRAGAEATYGAYNTINLSGFVSGPVNDTLGVRLAVKHDSADGWQHSYTTGATNGAVDFTQARAIVAWTPSARLKASLTLTGWVDRSDVQAGQLVAITPSVPAAAGYVPGLLNYPLAPNNAEAADFNPGQDYGRDNTFVQAVGRIDYTLPDAITFTSLTAYSHYRENQLQDIDGTTLSGLSQQTYGKIDSISEELRATGDLTRRGHFTAGFNYAHDDVRELNHDVLVQSTQAYLFVPLGGTLFADFNDSNNQKVDTIAGFANADYNLTDTLNIYGGVRYTDTRNHFNGCSSDSGDDNAAANFGLFQNYLRGLFGLPANPAIPPGGCVTANAAYVPGLIVSTLDEDNVSWRGGAQWKPTPGVLLYANASKGFKAGGYPSLGATAAAQYLPAVQESVIAYEGGFKATLLANTLQLNGAVFYYDYRDKQVLGRVLDPVFGPLLKLVNVPTSHITGAELQTTWVPVRGLNIAVGGSFIDSKIDGSFVNYDPNGALVDFKGEAFPNTPKWQLTSDISYRWPVTEALNAFVGGGVYYQTSTNSQLGDLPLLEVNAYSLIDLRAGVETKDRRWRVSVWGRNVGNTFYATTINRDLDTTVRFAGMPATYGVTVSYLSW
jgi:outer membrane receptor protein involved in Fe transport